MKLIKIISEIKQLPGNFPPVIELYHYYDKDKYPILRDYKINKIEDNRIKYYFLNLDGEEITDNLENKTLWQIAEQIDPNFALENFMHLIKALFPMIKIKSAYN
jgi:hypothetical protein